MGESYTNRLIYINDWQAGVTPLAFNWWSKSSYYCWYCSNCWGNVRLFLHSFVRRLTYICLSLSFCCPHLHSKGRFLRSSTAGNENVIKTIQSSTPWKSPIMDEAPGPPFSLYEDECVFIWAMKLRSKQTKVWGALFLGTSVIQRTRTTIEKHVMEWNDNLAIDSPSTYFALL